ncbi:hypothetical protein Csa_020489 [Cucumis sativus]|nr:hypothetical protein Csa_020489 [Cucumis sativus]
MVSICVLTDFYGWQQIVLKQIHSEVGYFSKDEDGLHLNHKPRCSAPIFYLSGIGGNMLAMGGDELLEAQSHIWNHIFNFINSMSLKCAIQLGIPDAIHSHGPNPMPLSLLVSSLQLHPNKTQFIYRLMRLLTHSGFFVQQEEGYILTNSSRLLLKDNPCAVSPFLLSMLQPALTDPWQFLSIWFQTDDQTPFETAHGVPSGST